MTTPYASGPAEFEAWARSIGLINESHGVMSVNSATSLTLLAWQASESRASDRIQALEAQVAELKRDAEWSPVESAPDGGMVLAFNRVERVSIESTGNIHGSLAAAQMDGDECFYTHWKPLPAPPSAAMAPAQLG